jgi:hypothetical protein
MTKDETKRNIAVEQAYVDGKTIQSRQWGRNDVWVTDLDPNWNWAFREYRVKPKPREFWINVYSDRNSWVHLTREVADTKAGVDRTACIHVREVTE